MPMSKRYIKAEKWNVPEPLQYLDVFGLHKLYDAIAFKANLILAGPPGIGKTLSVASWCQKHAVPLIPFDCSEDVRRAQLYGARTIEDGSSPFLLGAIPTAIEVANDVGMAVLNLEEINALKPANQKGLNSITDFRRALALQEAEEVYRLKKNSKLWIVGTMNFAVYGGVYALNNDLRSRFRIYPLRYPTAENEKKIVVEVLGTDGAGAPYIDKVILLAHQTRQEALEYQLATRDVVQIIQDIGNAGLETAMRLALGKFDGSDQQTFASWVTSIFNIDLSL